MTQTPATETLIFADGDTSALRQAVRRGGARRVHRGIFTRDLETPLEELVRRNAWTLVAHLAPGAVITDRTRRNPSIPPLPQPAQIFCAHPAGRRRFDLPGLTVVARPGAGPLPGDVPFDGLYLASEPRALLENARVTRQQKEVPASTLSRAELEAWIDELATAYGPERLDHVRDQARELSPALDAPRELAVVDRLIGAALGTRRVTARSEALSARQHGRPFDQRRVSAFERLAEDLAARSPVVLPMGDESRRAMMPFFEEYFSNFIEGTEFTIEEAEEIVFQGEIPADRPADAHDVVGTFEIVSNLKEMTHRAETIDEFLALLQRRHGVLMPGRPEAEPGRWKQRCIPSTTETVVSRE